MDFNDREKSIERVNKIRLEILEYLTASIKYVLEKMDNSILERLEEIRLRANRPLMVETGEQEGFVSMRGEFSENAEQAYVVKQKELRYTLEMMCENSIYAFQQDINKGFITLKGGHRVGITGKVILDRGKIINIKDISGMNIRLAREHIGCGKEVMKSLIKGKKDIYNTLLVSPPQCGKTTMLRDLARLISDGIPELSYEGMKVGIIDERSEIAACYRGVPQNNVGVRSDVLDGCDKRTGMEMILRSMSPDVIIVDELGNPGDIEAVMNVSNAGVRVLASTHGYSLEDIQSRKFTKWLVESGVFERFVILDEKIKRGKIKEVLEGTKDGYICFK